jgi:GNAT superfamily N-acetyltransferase
VQIRAGDERDLASMLRLLDAAVVWLVARGATGQWGSDAFSANAATVDYLASIVGSGELRIAEDAGARALGGYVLGDRPAYAPAIPEPERYLEAMVVDRAHAGRGIGARLVADAVDRARIAGATVLRADCWAQAGRLIGWYEEQGFVRGDVVRVGDWPAQLLLMPVPARAQINGAAGRAPSADR